MMKNLLYAFAVDANYISFDCKYASRLQLSISDAFYARLFKTFHITTVINKKTFESAIIIELYCEKYALIKDILKIYERPLWP